MFDECKRWDTSVSPRAGAALALAGRVGGSRPEAPAAAVPVPLPPAASLSDAEATDPGLKSASDLCFRFLPPVG